MGDAADTFNWGVTRPVAGLIGRRSCSWEDLSNDGGLTFSSLRLRADNGAGTTLVTPSGSSEGFGFSAKSLAPAPPARGLNAVAAVAALVAFRHFSEVVFFAIIGPRPGRNWGSCDSSDGVSAVAVVVVWATSAFMCLFATLVLFSILRGGSWSFFGSFEAVDFAACLGSSFWGGGVGVGIGEVKAPGILASSCEGVGCGIGGRRCSTLDFTPRGSGTSGSFADFIWPEYGLLSSRGGLFLSGGCLSPLGAFLSEALLTGARAPDGALVGSVDGTLCIEGRILSPEEEVGGVLSVGAGERLKPSENGLLRGPNGPWSGVILPESEAFRGEKGRPSLISELGGGGGDMFE